VQVHYFIIHIKKDMEVYSVSRRITSNNYKNSADMVLLEKKRNGVAILTVNAPPLNLFSLAMTKALDCRLHEISNDQEIRSLVVTGAGEKSFGAGSDVKEFPNLIETDTVIEKKLRYEMEVHNRLENLPQPTIAAIQGIALGGGLELALCCDLRVIADNAFLAFPEIALGVYPGTGMILLPRLIGESRAKELMYLGKKIDANQAFLWGLVNKVVPGKDVLIIAQEIAQEIADYPSITEKVIKKGVNMIRGLSRKESVEICLNLSKKVFNTKDTKEAIDAFIEKRKPHFRHQ